MTWGFLDNRIRYGDSKVNVESSFYNMSDNYYEAWFKVDSTDKKDKKYDVVFRWYNVSKYFTNDPSKVKYSQLEKMLRNIVYKCDVRMYSSDPSFIYQGCWEGLDKNELSIFKYNGPKGDDVWNDRHMKSGGLNNKNVHLTKHLTQIASYIEQYIPRMAQLLQVDFK